MIDALWRLLYRAAWVVRLGYGFVVRPRIGGAHVAVWHGERVLLVKNSYRRSLGFPAGGVKSGERVVDCAARELAEEVGIRVSPEDLRLVQLVDCVHEYHRDRASVFEISFESEPPHVVDRREVLWARFVLRAEIDLDDLNPIARTYLADLDAGAREAPRESTWSPPPEQAG